MTSPRKKDRGQLTLRLPKALKDRLTAERKRTGASYTYQAIAALDQWLKAREGRDA